MKSKTRKRLIIEFIKSINVDTIKIEAGSEITVTRLDGSYKQRPDGTFIILITGHNK